MKKTYQLLLFVFLVLTSPLTVNAQCEDVTLKSLTDPGPFNVETLTEADGIRNGPDYQGATIYYPSNATPPYASIAIVPGFTAPPSSVEDWGPFYASHGIVTIIIGTNSPFDFPEARARALLDALETLRQENERVDSPLIDHLDLTQLAVSGWSMGGGGAQRAAVLEPSIKSVVALCPWLPNPSINHDSPVLIFSGQNDPTAPPQFHANIHYDETPDTTTKLLFEVENGNHSVANSPNGANGVVGKIALSWLKLHLEDNPCYCPLLTESLLVNPPDASMVQTNIECEPILGIQENTFDVVLFPNPTQNFLTVVAPNDVTVAVYSPFGNKLIERHLTGNNKQLDLTAFAAGIYYVRIKNETYKIVKK